MKDKEQLLKEVEDIGVFTYKDGEYLCTGYDFDVTRYFVDMHKLLNKLRLGKIPAYESNAIKAGNKLL